MVWFVELGENFEEADLVLQQGEFGEGHEELGDDELTLREAAFMSGYDADEMNTYYYEGEDEDVQ